MEVSHEIGVYASDLVKFEEKIMQVYLIKDPMATALFHNLLNRSGWNVIENEAECPNDPKCILQDIDQVPCADGQQRILFEANDRSYHRLCQMTSVVGEDDPDFWDTLGIEIEN